MSLGLGRPLIAAGFTRDRLAVPQRKLPPTDRRRHTKPEAGCCRAATQSIINYRNNAGSPGCRDTASMDRQCHSPDHPGASRTLQPRIAVDLRPTHQRKYPIRCRVVSKDQSDLQ